ncbi:MAG: sodium:calcium antiporter, partial [Promethearchaeota archaeon]
MLLISIIFILVSFIGMYYGAKLVVISLENIAYRLGVSQLLIGLTILAIGTSLPEISVSIMGGVDKLYGIDPNVDGIIIGNKIGSFLTQITLILGILGLSQSVYVSKWILRREGIMLFLSLFVFLLCAIDGVITRLDAIIMIAIYFIYLLIVIISEKKLERKRQDIEYSEKERLDP